MQTYPLLEKHSTQLPAILLLLLQDYLNDHRDENDEEDEDDDHDHNHAHEDDDRVDHDVIIDDSIASCCSRTISMMINHSALQIMIVM